MRIITWGMGAALALSATTARAAPPTEREVGEDEPIEEVAEAATPVGTACRAGCATSYAALCLRIQQICAVSTVVTIGDMAIPCVTAIGATCLTSAALAVVCADRCPP